MSHLPRSLEWALHIVGVGHVELQNDFGSPVHLKPSPTSSARSDRDSRALGLISCVWSFQCLVYMLGVGGLLPLFLGFSQSTARCLAHQRCSLMCCYCTETLSDTGRHGMVLWVLESSGWPALLLPWSCFHSPPGCSHRSLWRAVRGCVWGCLNCGLRAREGSGFWKEQKGHC